MLSALFGAFVFGTKLRCIIASPGLRTTTLADPSTCVLCRQKTRFSLGETLSNIIYENSRSNLANCRTKNVKVTAV